MSSTAVKTAETANSQTQKQMFAPQSQHRSSILFSGPKKKLYSKLYALILRTSTLSFPQLVFSVLIILEYTLYVA